MITTLRLRIWRKRCLRKWRCVGVFRYPNDPKEFFLKRIIGLPGERIKIADGIITIYNTAHPEGKELHESYLPTDLYTIGEETAVIGENEYYVMGDNRSNSFDSRRFGAVNKSMIVGRAWFRGWPFSRIETFEAPLFNL
jgi:signal peptidase I